MRVLPALRRGGVYRLPYIAELVAARTGGQEKGTLDAADLGFHRAEYERLVARLEEEHQRSGLPEQNSAMAELSDLLVRFRSLI